MKEKILEKLIELIKVKSIITILTFIAFFYLSVTKQIDKFFFLFLF